MSNEELAACIGTALDAVRESQSALTVAVKQALRNVSAHERENQAIGLLVVHGPKLTKIASELGVSRRELYRYPRFMNAVETIKARKHEKAGARSYSADEDEC